MVPRNLCRALGVLLVFAFTAMPLSALAATTGGLTGTVVDSQSRAPIGGAQVTISSPTQVEHATTDASGRYTFISLGPDTYTLSVAREGYDVQSIAGVTVFAGQTLNIPVAMQKSLKTIANVTSRSPLSVVRAGTGTDVYSVGPQLTAAAAPLGGGGSLNTAYSAIASMPGAYVPPNQVGVNQTVYIRGSYYDQIGFEYDGIPVNRAFDNYPTSGLSTLGQQELQIFTGGGQSDVNATGLGGFINQITKTGTYPGYGTVNAGMGSPTFYHNLSVEAGGSSPNRLFSYYIGLSGNNQDFRYFDQFNGASITDAIPYGYWPSHQTSLTISFWPAMYPTCNNDGSYDNPAVDNNSLLYNDPGCFGSYNANYGQPSTVDNREVVSNFHFGIPHKHDGGRDDVQALFMSSANFTQFYTSVNDAGGLGRGLNAVVPNDWPDAYTYPAGTGFLAPASTPPIGYMYPGSPTGRCVNVTGVPNACPVDSDGNQITSNIPTDYRDGRWDTASIVKLQYQHNMGTNAYARLFGYTFYSNTNRATANGYGNNITFGVGNYDYEVGAHTSGLEFQAADQISDKHLLNVMASYTQSNTLRYFNHNYLNSGDQQVSNFTNGSQCFATTSGAGIDPNSNYAAGEPAPCNDPISQGTFTTPYGSFTGQNPCTDGELPASAAACRSNATMALTFLGNQGDINAVTPRVTAASLSDEWRPNDHWNVNLSARFENDSFDLTNTNSPGSNFWFAAAQKEFCVNPVTRQPVFVPQPPQSIRLATPYVTFNCPVDTSLGTPIQTVHPDGTDGILLTNNYPSIYSQKYIEPRVSATYTVNPDTVLRFSAGRYAQQPQNYEIQYTTEEPNLAATLLGFIPFGFNSPLHESQAQFSNNYDLSYEHHFKGTDMSVKITPYYRWGTNQLYETVNLPSLNVSPSFNSGTLRVDGVELELAKGDFAKNGLAGTLSYTYTNAAEKWDNYPNSTIGPVDQYNQDIQAFNALTKAGGGSQCYSNNFSAGTNDPDQVLPDPTCVQVFDAGGNAYNPPIRNPYYGMSKQGLLDPHGWYTPGLDFPYISPNTLSLVLNYRHNRFDVATAMELQQGTTYGTPADVIGIDPRNCRSNQGTDGITTGDPLNADYTSCHYALTSDGTNPGYLYIPNPQTGTFASFGQYRQPWQFNLGMQLSYDFSPRITGSLMLTSLVNTCFGGSKTPWSTAYSPSGNTCGYASNTFYVGGGFYNGTSFNDTAANGVPAQKYFTQSYVPTYGDPNSGNYPLALNAYFQVKIKL